MNHVAFQVSVLIIHEASFRVKLHGFVDHQVSQLSGCDIVDLVAPYAAADFWLAQSGGSSGSVACRCPGQRAVRGGLASQHPLRQRGRPARCVAAGWDGGVLTVAPGSCVVTIALIAILNSKVLIALAELRACPYRGMVTHIGNDAFAR